MNKITVEKHDGRLRLRWQYEGKRYTMACGVADDAIGKAVAKRKASEIEGDMLTGNFDATLLKYKPRLLGRNHTEVPVPDLFQRFTQALKQDKGLTAGALCKYQGCLSHLKRSLNTPAHQVTGKTAANFSAVLLEQVSDRTAKSYLFLLKACWDWADGKYHIASENPWLGLAAKVKCQPIQKRKPFTSAEVRAILGAFKVDRYYSHYYPFVHFLFGVGCRPGEAIGLKWKHLADDFSTVWIGESVSRGVRKGTKTGKTRTVLLTPSVQAMLRERKASHDPKPDDLVFPAPKGGLISDRLFCRRAWRTILNRLGIEYRPPYTARHSAISHALAAGADPLDVAEQTGHHPKTLFQHYASAIESKPIFAEF